MGDDRPSDRIPNEARTDAGTRHGVVSSRGERALRRRQRPLKNVGGNFWLFPPAGTPVSYKITVGEPPKRAVDWQREQMRADRPDPHQGGSP
jgi:hypothetical protein